MGGKSDDISIVLARIVPKDFVIEEQKEDEEVVDEV